MPAIPSITRISSADFGAQAFSGTHQASWDFCLRRGEAASQRAVAFHASTDLHGDYMIIYPAFAPEKAMSARASMIVIAKKQTGRTATRGVVP